MFLRFLIKGLNYQAYYFDSIPYDIILANYLNYKPDYFCYLFSDVHNSSMKALYRTARLKLKDKEWDIFREDKTNKNG